MDGDENGDFEANAISRFEVVQSAGFAPKAGIPSRSNTIVRFLPHR